jgi:hypothetical protein
MLKSFLFIAFSPLTNSLKIPAIPHQHIINRLFNHFGSRLNVFKTGQQIGFLMDFSVLPDLDQPAVWG